MDMFENEALGIVKQAGGSIGSKTTFHFTGSKKDISNPINPINPK